MSMQDVASKIVQEELQKMIKEAKEKAKSESGKELFDLLIRWEKVHLDQFTNQYNVLKEEWWAEQRYFPF